MTPSDTPQPATRLLGRNAVFSTITAGSASLLLVLQVAFARTLGNDAFGRFSWALTLATLGEALMDLGLHQVTIRAVARDRSQARRLLDNSLALKALTGAAMLVVMGGVTMLVGRLFGLDPDVRTATLVLLVSAVLRSYLLTVRGVLQGLEQFGRDCLVVVGDRVLLLAVAGSALWQGAGLVGVATAFVLARVLSVIGALIMARGRAGGLALGFDFQLWRDLQRQALPIGVFLIVLNFYSYIDTFMLGLISTYTDTGLYNYAYRIYEGLSYAPAILSALLTPRLSHLASVDLARHRRLAHQGIAAAALLAVALAVPIAWFAGPLLAVVFGPDARQATLALRLLSGGLAFIFVIWILQAVAISVFRERLLLTTTAIGAVANVALNLHLIPRYGRDGAALATLVGEGLTMTLLLYGLRRVLFGRVRA
jgi:O-antigen/teichoic acid export membrane protein